MSYLLSYLIQQEIKEYLLRTQATIAVPREWREKFDTLGARNSNSVVRPVSRVEFSSVLIGLLSARSFM